VGKRRINAAAVTRAATAAAGDQPAFNSERAKEPDVLKAAAEKRASAIPEPREAKAGFMAYPVMGKD